MRKRLFHLRRLALFCCLLGAVVGAGGCAAPRWTPAPDAERTVAIGILSRRQVTTDICESRPYRHIDVLLPTGKIYGFNTAEVENSFLHNIVFRSRGVVRSNDLLRRERRHYINLAAAKNFVFGGEDNLKMITDWSEIRVTPAQAAALEREWETLEANPPLFRLAGMNCATRVQECFARAGILPSVGIPSIDRPENLIKLARRYYPEMTTRRGYFGLDENGYPTIEVEDNCP
jgi:hypothetical protein